MNTGTTRLYLDDHVILLADRVRDRVNAYLTYRAATWSASINAHLFIQPQWEDHQAGHLGLDRPAALPRSSPDRSVRH